MENINYDCIIDYRMNITILKYDLYLIQNVFISYRMDSQIVLLLVQNYPTVAPFMNMKKILVVASAKVTYILIILTTLTLING